MLFDGDRVGALCDADRVGVSVGSADADGLDDADTEGDALMLGDAAT
jgi:hypothetical protein